MFGYKAYLLIALTVVAFVLMACGTAPAAAVMPQIIEVERVVERVVPVETVREVVKEVPVERVVEVEKIVEVVRDRDPGSLVIYSGRSESLVEPIIEQFEEVTGINVAVKYGSTGEIAATILEEGQNSLRMYSSRRTQAVLAKWRMQACSRRFRRALRRRFRHGRVHLRASG